MRLRYLKTLLVITVIIIPCTVWSALDSPHNATSSLNCGNCHWIGANPPWQNVTTPPGRELDYSLNNKRCYACHKPGNPTYPEAETHSSATTSSQKWSGLWTTECVNCHNPHQQMQYRSWRTDPDIVIASGSFTVTGVGTYDSANNRTLITLSVALTSEYNGYYFIPDKNYPFFYKIISSTLNQSQFYVKGDVIESYVRGNGYMIIYGKNIVSSLTYTNPGYQTLSANIKFFRPVGTKSFIDTNNYSTSLCQACHTQTSNFSKTNPNHTPAISQGQRCTDCHIHIKGFGDICDSCHGNPPTTATIGGSTGLADPATGATNPLSPGAHSVHVSTRGMTCDVCHRGTAMPASERKIDMGFSITATTYPGFQGTVESGTFTGYNALLNGYTWNASWPGTTVLTAANYDNRCSSIYCHGSTLTGGSNTTPSWIGGSLEAACGTCHGASATAPPTTGSHTKHAGSATGYSLPCTTCHAAVSDGSHVNGSVAWDLDDTDPRIGASATYRGANAGQTGQLAPSATYGSCSNIYCHSDVQGAGGSGSPSTYATPTWGGTVVCGDCHNADGVQGRGTIMNTGSHTKHVSTYGYACSTCHNTAGSGTQKHADYNIDILINTTYGASASYSQMPSNPPGNGYGTCSSVYCHGSGTPTWGGIVTCSSCHTDDMGITGTAVRRGIYKAGNDFTKTSHHISGTPADASCVVCHDKSNHTREGDPNVRIYNEDTGAAILYNGTGGSLEGFCVSCHDSDGASRLGVNAKKPFTDSGDITAPPDIGWNSAQAAHSALTNKCMACHGNSGATNTTLDPVINAHGSVSAKLLRYTGWTATDESGFCYNCHGNPPANGAQDNIQSMFAKIYSHSIKNCADCHNKHMATPTNKINGVSGVSPSNGGNWTVPASYSQVTVNDPFKQYQVCFKCHSDYSGGPPIGTTNVALEFNVNNYSYHYVEGDIITAAPLPSNGTGCNSYGPLAGSTQIPRASTTRGNFNNTYIGVMEPSLSGLTDAQRRSAKLKCSSCHGPDGAGGTTPEGPHGSAYSFILKVPSGSPYTTWNNTVTKNSGTVWCFNCHDPNFTNTGFTSGGTNLHTSKHNGRACQYCHVAIPHGWKRYRLIRFENCDSAPYVGRTGGLSSGVTWKTSGNWSESDCHNGAVGSCG